MRTIIKAALCIGVFLVMLAIITKADLIPSLKLSHKYTWWELVIGQVLVIVCGAFLAFPSEGVPEYSRKRLNPLEDTGDGDNLLR